MSDEDFDDYRVHQTFNPGLASFSATRAVVDGIPSDYYGIYRRTMFQLIQEHESCLGNRCNFDADADIVSVDDKAAMLPMSRSTSDAARWKPGDPVYGGRS